jgi:hypothetical protein
MCAGSSASRARPATRFSIAIGSMVVRLSVIARGDRYDTPISCRRRLSARSLRSSAKSRIGAPARSASFCSGGLQAMSGFRLRAPFMPCSIAMAWSSAGQKASPCHRNAAVTRDGAQRSVVRRLQGRVPARQQALVLSTDRRRSRLAFCAAV